MGSQTNHCRRSKRKSYDNQSVRPRKLKVNTEGNNSCLRPRELEKSFQDVPLLDEESNDYNIIINFEILKQFSRRFIVCSECLSKNIKFGDDLSCRIGYAHKIYIFCRECSYRESTYRSKQSQNVWKSQGRIKFGINIRKVAAFGEIGKGLEGIQNVTRCLNMFSIGDPSYKPLMRNS